MTHGKSKQKKLPVRMIICWIYQKRLQNSHANKFLKETMRKEVTKGMRTMLHQIENIKKKQKLLKKN